MNNAPRHPTFEHSLVTVDLLRVIASAGIVVYHYREYLSQRSLSLISGLSFEWFTLWVDMFFAISGFVISYVYYIKIEDGKFQYLDFLKKRVARLIPLHWLTLLFFAGLAILIMFGVKADDTSRFDWGCFFPNALLVHSFAVCPKVSFNTVSWSISAEMAMYFLFPVFAFAMHRLGGLIVLIVSLAMICVLMYMSMRTGSQEWLSWASQWGGIRAIPSFLIGMTIYSFRQRISSPSIVRSLATVSIVALFWLGFSGFPRMALLPLIYVVVFTCVKFDVLKMPGKIIQKIGPFGQLTYSIYMLHLPVATAMMFVSKKLLKLQGFENDAWVLLTVVVLIPSSMISYRYIEMPARRMITEMGLSSRRPFLRA